MKTLRQMKCWTQKYTAVKFGVSVRTIEAWEQGRTHISKPGRIIYNHYLSTGPAIPNNKQTETINDKFPGYFNNVQMKNDVAIINGLVKIDREGKIIC